jgi:S-adenosylmethionine hydrolase
MAKSAGFSQKRHLTRAVHTSGYPPTSSVFKPSVKPVHTLTGFSMKDDRVITLTTDFGEASPYVAAMKGVVLSMNPSARLVDLSHAIPPQEVRHAAYFLAAALPYFPPSTIHVIVVDPGVGTDRAVLSIEWAGQRLLAPDNGCWTLVPGADQAVVRRVTNPRYFRAEVSRTFHGRDIFAPVAGHLSRGVPAEELGPRVREWVRLESPSPRQGKKSITGEVVFVDHFGNMVTNIPASAVPGAPVGLKLGRRSISSFRWVNAYGEAPCASLVVLTSSTGMIEIAKVQGNAARQLRAKVGTVVTLVLA